MRQGKLFQYSIATGWFVMALTAVLVATVLVPKDNRSAYFWLRVGWSEFLIFLFWGSISFYLFASGKAKDHVARLSGIAPTIFIVTTIYVLLSFVVMMIHASVPETDAWNRIHIITQIVFFSGAMLCIVFLSMARTGATVGLGFSKSKTMSPRELHDLLSVHESSLSKGGDAANGLKASMKKLREALLYLFNESTSLARSPEYKVLSEEVQKLCLSVEEGHLYSEDADVCYSTLIKTAKYLLAKAKFISSNQVRR